MEFEIMLEIFRQKVKHLFPNEILGVFYMKVQSYANIIENNLGLKYLGLSRRESCFYLKFKIIDNKKYILAKLKYDL